MGGTVIKKYQRIVNKIIDDIGTGLLEPNEQISTEEELAEEFSVSRVTVRRAINELIEKGYLEKKKGKGTYVKSSIVHKQLNDVVSFYKSSILRGEVPSTRLIELKLVNPPLLARKNLKLAENEKVWFIKRIRLTNGFPLIYEESYWNYNLVGELTEDIVSESVFRYLKTKFKIAYATEDIDAISADENLSQLLDVSVGFPIVRTTMTFYTDNDEPFEISVNYHRTDRLKLTLFRTLNE